MGWIAQCDAGDRRDIACIDPGPLRRAEGSGDQSLLRDAGRELEQHLHLHGRPKPRHIQSGRRNRILGFAVPAQHTSATHLGVGAHAGQLHEARRARRLRGVDQPQLSFSDLGHRGACEENGFDALNGPLHARLIVEVAGRSLDVGRQRRSFAPRLHKHADGNGMLRQLGDHRFADMARCIRH